MPEHKRYDAAVVIKSHLKLLLFFFFFFWAEVSSRLCCRPTSKASYSYAAALALRTALLGARVCGLWGAVNAADVARRRRHSHGTLKKQLLTQTVLAMSAVPSAQNVAAVFTRATPPCWRPPLLVPAPLPKRLFKQAKDSSSKARACRART